MSEFSRPLRYHAEAIEDVAQTIADHIDDAADRVDDAAREATRRLSDARREVESAAPRLQHHWGRVKSALSEFGADPSGPTEGVARAFDGLSAEARRLFERITGRTRRFRVLPWRQ